MLTLELVLIGDLTTSIGLYGRSGNTRPQHLMFCAKDLKHNRTSSILKGFSTIGERVIIPTFPNNKPATSNTDTVYRYFPFEVSEKFVNQLLYLGFASNWLFLWTIFCQL